MRMTIAQRLRPFSHQPGISLLLPGTPFSVQVFPAELRIHGQGKLEIDAEGPVRDFTVMQDLERGRIYVWGHAVSGYFRYRLTGTDSGNILMVFEHAPMYGLGLRWKPSGEFDVWQQAASSLDICAVLLSKQSVQIGPSWKEGVRLFSPQNRERLAFGCHKSQQWEHVSERLDMAEIFPVWFRLGQLIQSKNDVLGSGTTRLLLQCREVIEYGSSNAIVPSFENLFRAGFSGLMQPRLVDEGCHGFVLNEPLYREDARTLLTIGSKLIRSLFVTHRQRWIELLPLLPQELHCGRFLNVACGQAGELDLEWSKHSLRRVIFRCAETGEWNFRFQRHLARFRLRQGNKDPGHFIECGTPINCLAGRHYYLDNFQKG